MIVGARRDLISRRTLLAGAATMLFPPRARSEFAHTQSFPVTITHALGETIVPSMPRRIATVGWCDEDSLLALGVLPVGMVRRGMFESGIAPWCEEKLGGVRPVLLEGGLSNYERLLSLEPDLIINVFSDMDTSAYRRLSAIAPTIGYTSGPWRADWREQTLQIGKALGKATAAEDLIVQTASFLADLARQYSDLAGRSFTFGTYFPGSASMVVYLPGETRVDWLLDLGMRVSPGIAELAEQNPGKTSLDVSLEQLDRVEADILIMWYDGGARNAMETQPLFQLFRPVATGAYAVFDDPVSIWSASWPSVLAIPYGFPKLLPRLAQAAKAAPASVKVVP